MVFLINGIPVLVIECKNATKDWAHKLGVRVRTVTVRPMRNKWASCSTSGNLHFDSELLSLDRKLGDYVIVHELLHFSVPNHGKLWKSLMHAHLGDFVRLEKSLQALASSRPVQRDLLSRRFQNQ